MRTRILCAAALLSASCFAHADDASQQKAIEKLLETTHAEAQVNGIREHMLAQLSEIAGQQAQGELNETQKAAVARYTKEATDLFGKHLAWDKIRTVQVAAYQKAFTEQEIQALNTFYATPVGQKMLTQMPAIVAASTDEIRSDMQALMPELEQIAQKMIAELAGPEKAAAEEAAQTEEAAKTDEAPKAAKPAKKAAKSAKKTKG